MHHFVHRSGSNWYNRLTGIDGMRASTPVSQLEKLLPEHFRQ
jgi:hypothetical protein